MASGSKVASSRTSRPPSNRCARVRTGGTRALLPAMGARSVSTFGNGLVALALAALGVILLMGALRALERPVSARTAAVRIAPIALLTPQASAAVAGTAVRRPRLPAARRAVASRPRPARPSARPVPQRPLARPAPARPLARSVPPARRVRHAPAASRTTVVAPAVALPIPVRSTPVAVSVAPAPPKHLRKRPRFSTPLASPAELLRKRLARRPSPRLSMVDEGTGVSVDDPSDLPDLQRPRRHRR